MSSIKWKDGAQCAALITVNLDAENLWMALEGRGHDYPKTLSLGTYGMERGLPRLLSLFDDLGIKATFFVPGSTAVNYADEIKEIAAKGHEIAMRGYDLLNWAMLPPQRCSEDMAKGASVLKEQIGVKPIGYRAPIYEFTIETLRDAHENGALYDSSLSADDRPYWLDLKNGEKILEIPIHWELYDLQYFVYNARPPMPSSQARIANYTQSFNNMREEFLGYVDRGGCCTLQFEPQTACTPGRMSLLRDLLTEIVENKNAWVTTCKEIYEYWYKEYPPK